MGLVLKFKLTIKKEENKMANITFAKEQTNNFKIEQKRYKILVVDDD